ncbi:MAG: response regulator [Deltaproteobacteria bacterium]|nr:response regulator [Deltaproteobacteria bacterium]
MFTSNISDHSSVLIVDDNIKNLQVLGGFLQKESLSVEFALDGKSALSWLEKKKFDIVLLDVMMPEMDGFEVCKEIKKNKLNEDIPVIFITAKTDTESIVNGFDAGAVDYITKPFIQSELLARVRTHLNIQNSKRQIINYLNEIEEKNKNINQSIEYARYIQKAVMSESDNNLKYLPEHFVLNMPKDILSGDFYWVNKIEKDLLIAVMDCTGHGVPGALMSILGITSFYDTVIRDHIFSPESILEHLRIKIMHSLGNQWGISIKDGMEGSVIRIDPVSPKLYYSGSFNPLLIIRKDEIRCIKADRIPIGYSEIKGNFTLHKIDIEKDDTIYLFSDGINDQFGDPGGKRFMLCRFKELLLKIKNESMSRQKEILFEKHNMWRCDSPQTDDILVMGIRF